MTLSTSNDQIGTINGEIEPPLWHLKCQFLKIKMNNVTPLLKTHPVAQTHLSQVKHFTDHKYLLE